MKPEKRLSPGHTPNQAGALTRPPARPKRGVFYGWRMLAAALPIVIVSHGVTRSAYGLYFEPFQNELGWSVTTIALLFSLHRVESGILSPITGYLTDRLGGRVMVLAGMLILGVGLLLASQIHSLWQFYATFLIINMGNSIGGVATIWAVMVKWFHRYRGRALGIINAGTVGYFLVPGIAWIITTAGWRVALAASGVSVLAICVPLALAIRSRPQDYGLLPDGAEPQEAPGEASKLAPLPQEERNSEGVEVPSVREALHTPAFWLITIATAVYGMSHETSRLLLIPHLENGGFSRELAGASTAMIALIGLPSRPLTGWLADRVDVRKAYPVLFLAQAAGLVILAYSTRLWHLAVFAVVSEPAWGASLVFQNVLASQFFGVRHFATIRGFMAPASVVIGVIGPVLGGVIFDATHSYQPLFLLLSAISLLGAVPIALARPARHGHPLSPSL